MSEWDLYWTSCPEIHSKSSHLTFTSSNPIRKPSTTSWGRFGRSSSCWTVLSENTVTRSDRAWTREHGQIQGYKRCMASAVRWFNRRERERWEELLYQDRRRREWQETREGPPSGCGALQASARGRLNWPRKEWNGVRHNLVESQRSPFKSRGWWISHSILKLGNL